MIIDTLIINIIIIITANTVNTFNEDNVLMIMCENDRYSIMIQYWPECVMTEGYLIEWQTNEQY